MRKLLLTIIITIMAIPVFGQTVGGLNRLLTNWPYNVSFGGTFGISGTLTLTGLLDGNGTSATLNNTFADSLDITGELTATTIITTGSITDGTYTSDGVGNFTGIAALTTTGLVTVGGLIDGNGTGIATDNTLADSLIVTGQVDASTGFTDGTFTVDGSGVFTGVADLTATNDITADSLIGDSGIRTDGLLLGKGTAIAANNTLADTLDIVGELTATTIVTTGSITDGTYTSDGTGGFTGVADMTVTNDVTADSVVATTGFRTAGAEISSIIHQTTNSSLTISTNGNGQILLDVTPATGADGFVKIGDTGTAGEFVQIDSVGNTTIGGWLVGSGTGATTNNTLADSLDITGELTATTIVTTGSITDGTYTSDGTGTFTGVAALTSTLLTTTGFNQPGIAVTNTDTFIVSAANSGRVHLIGDLAQNVLIILPAAAAGLNYEFWYYGAAAETHDDTLIALNSGDFFKGNLLFADVANAISSVYSNGSTNWELALNNMNGGTVIKVFADATNWFITGTVVSDGAPVFADH